MQTKFLNPLCAFASSIRVRTVSGLPAMKVPNSISSLMVYRLKEVPLRLAMMPRKDAIDAYRPERVFRVPEEIFAAICS
jgi:hypothetical protein